MSYSDDLRQRVVSAYHDGEGTFEEVSARFKVGSATLKRWVQLERETGSLAPRTQNNRRPLSLSDSEQALLIDGRPDGTDRWLSEEMEERIGRRISPKTINDYWHRWGYTRKKRRLSLPNKPRAASTP